ncbi:hypothetical protein VE00_08115 [Pseudogymnoascus sp. WSF 3629]|nr:hypothetical protein VE00_08115 [Pseudogymnoascus sp. WSF 3629]
MSDVNGRLLKNTLAALELASTVPKRFVLQTGGKTYENSFYYRQEDSLIAFAKKHHISYNIVIPAWILGAQHLGKRLDFPGDIVAWDKEQLQTTATMDSYFSEFWLVLAGWYGLKWDPPVVDAEYTEFEMPLNPRGYGPNGKIRFTFNLIEWASRPETQKAWAEIASKNGITHNPFDNIERVWTPANFALIRSWPNSVSMDKARKLGWHGYLDTHESIREIFEQMAKLKITPQLIN